jgi:CubicO group peptidase (beta-lactamase class C family)
MEHQRVPGVAVGIVSRGEPILIRGYGYANVEHQVPVKPETIFQVASLTKQFAATEVMLLVQEGRLGLDDPITKYLDGAPKQWQSITIRHLLNHTSGVHDTLPEDLRRDLSEDEIARRAFDHPLDFPPGSRWSYCNTGYELLGIVVRRVSGRSWGDFLRQRVFTPLGMTTARVISEEEIVPNRAAGYRLHHRSAGAHPVKK